MSNDGKHIQAGKLRSRASGKEIGGSMSHELLEQYLALSAENRDRKFPDTAYAATLVGLSRRTIQFWVETGAVQAVFIGGKYRVSIDSLREYLKKREDERWQH